MMLKEVNVSQLATAVMHWLSYTSAVGRDYILSEGAIRFPASEYLERLSIDKIELEYGHPKLSRKRFDLFFKKDTKNNTAFEFKYIKHGSTRKQDEKERIFNDLMRLYLFLDTDHEGFFLICGSQNDFIKDFQVILDQPKDTDGTLYIKPKDKTTAPSTITPTGFYTEWFSFDAKNPQKNIDLNAGTPYKEIYDLFFSEYKDAYEKKAKTSLVRPATITTELAFLSGNIDQQTKLLQPSKIGIWKVVKPV